MAINRRLQVFISSTYQDLKEDRQAAVAAVLKAGHIPAGMELFTSGDLGQMQVIKRWIDESDVYMLILGGRYGSIEKTTNLSYTELEYDYAIEQKKPLFAVVIEESALEARAKIFGTSVIEKDSPRELKAFREKVLGNISAFFSDEKDIRLCVYESLADFSSNPELKGWVSASDVPDVARLREEIDRLRAENESLRREPIETLPSTDVDDNKSLTNGALEDILSTIEITLPASMSDGEEQEEKSLLDILYQYKDLLTNGVSNRTTGSDRVRFLYFNIAPKLQIHGLVDNEMVSGAGHRRSSLSGDGRRFVAWYEAKLLRERRGSDGASVQKVKTRTKRNAT